jgi:hypothetical protein
MHARLALQPGCACGCASTQPLSIQTTLMPNPFACDLRRPNKPSDHTSRPRAVKRNSIRCSISALHGYAHGFGSICMQFYPINRRHQHKSAILDQPGSHICFLVTLGMGLLVAASSAMTCMQPRQLVGGQLEAATPHASDVLQEPIWDASNPRGRLK